MVALRAAWASAIRACLRIEAASWLVTTATANSTTHRDDVVRVVDPEA